MRTKKPLLAAAGFALALTLALAGCDLLGLSGPSGPGELHATVVSPHSSLDGAVVLELSNVGSIGYVRSDHGQVFYQDNGNTTRVVVVLDDPGLITFFLRVDEVADLPEVTFIQVADAMNELRPTVSDYDLSWDQIADSDREFSRRAQ